MDMNMSTHTPQYVAVKSIPKIVCKICGGKALYHAGSKGYCKNHREEAVKLYLRKRDKWMTGVQREVAERCGRDDFNSVLEEIKS